MTILGRRGPRLRWGRREDGRPDERAAATSSGAKLARKGRGVPGEDERTARGRRVSERVWAGGRLDSGATGATGATGARRVAGTTGVARASGGDAPATTDAIAPAVVTSATTAAEPGAIPFRTYYGRSILKPPVWQGYVPAYFFTDGLAGASAGLALAATVADRRILARNAALVGMVGLLASPPLLIADLGRPDRFYNMLRVFKVTSPMSVGTWILSGAGAALSASAAGELLGAPRSVRLAAHAAAAVFGMPLATYTAALVSDTAVPAWHDGHRELPFVFAGSAAASAGGLAAAVTPPGDASPARWLAVAGAALELGAAAALEHRLGPLVAEPYRTGRGGTLTRLARACTTVGAVSLAVGGRRRGVAVGGGLLLAAGSLVERFAVAAAGVESARDPKYVVVPQRQRLEARERHAAGGPRQ